MSQHTPNGVAHAIDRALESLPSHIKKRPAAQFLGVSPRTVSRMLAERQLVGVQRKPGSTAPIFILKESLREYLLRNAL
jgi:hypothetical protein